MLQFTITDSKSLTQIWDGGNQSMFERFFRLSENGTNIHTEIIAGITTFLTMAYIIFVQPAILSAPISIPGSPMEGMDKNAFFGSVMVATCLSAAIATFIMALLANYPIALASGMGENVFFAFTVVVGMHVPWQVALGAIFISGLLCTILTVSKLRNVIMDAIPASLKNAIAGGIGLFIAFLGMQHCGIIIGNPNTMVSITRFAEHPEYVKPFALSVIGLIAIAILMSYKVKGAVLWGMLISSLIGIPMGIISPGELKHWQTVPSLAPTFMKLDFRGLFNISMISIILVFFLTDMFDMLGTLIGVSKRANLLDEKGRLKRAQKAFFADSFGSVIGAALGTSTVTSYIESAAGVEAGGRTGLTGVVTGICFLLAIFISPVVKMIGSGYMLSPNEASAILYPITGPVLVIVGILMVKAIIEINWDDVTEALPAFLVFIGIPLSFSISDGLALGLIAYPIIKVLAGRQKEVSWLVYILAALFVVRFFFVK